MGSENLNGLPSDPIRESVRLKEARQAKDMAVTMSGEATKAYVAGLASLRPVKLLLYKVITAQKTVRNMVALISNKDSVLMVGSPFLTSCLSH